MGLVFQEFELLEHLSVLDNILLPCRLTSQVRLTTDRYDRAKELARDTGIGDRLRRYVRQLSQGARQRIAVCRALLLEPTILLCDEPTGNLDPANKDQVLGILLVFVLSLQLRRRELETLTKIGASRGRTMAIMGTEVIGVLGLGALLSGGLALATSCFAPTAIRLLILVSSGD